jgi:acetyltransferase-like isoleucine patch superfamily enzyme
MAGDSSNKTGSYKINGENNKILIVSESSSERVLAQDERLDGLTVEIRGNNNFIKLHCPINFDTGTRIRILNDNVKVEIGPTPFFNMSLLCSLGDGQILRIKKNTVMVNVSIFLEGNTGLYIGEDCLFSDGPVFIRPCDGHSILDVETGEVVNAPLAPIVIGNHCWIGNSCKLIRGAKLPNNTIVGMGALVNKAFEEEYTVLAGIPAKIIKRGRKWDSRNPYRLMRETGQLSNYKE